MTDSIKPVTLGKYSKCHHYDAKQEQVLFQRRLRSLLTQPENKHCLDCSRPGPRWATLIVIPSLKVCGSIDIRNEGAVNASNIITASASIGDQILGHVHNGPHTVSIGGFCCLDCSGAHRKLGTHVTFVRSVDLDTFKEHEVQSLECAGNAVVNSIYEARLLTSKARENITNTSYLPGTFTYASKPYSDSDPRAREKFIRNKYEARMYLDFDILCQFYDMTGSTFTTAASTCSECTSSEPQTESILSLPGIHLCQVNNEPLTGPLKLQAFTTSPRNLKMLQKYMNQSGQCIFKPNQIGIFKKNKVKKKIHTILQCRKSTSTSSSNSHDVIQELGAKDFLPSRNMFLDEKDDLELVNKQSNCNRLSSGKINNPNNNEKVSKQFEMCNINHNFIFSGYHVANGSNIKVINKVVGSSGSNQNVKIRGKHVSDVFENYRSSMNTPQEPYQVDNNNRSLTVLYEVNHGSSNTCIRSAIKRGWSSTAKRLAWRKGQKKKTSKPVTPSRASIINSNEKINSGNMVLNDNRILHDSQPVLPENYTQDSSLSSSSNYFDNTDISYTRMSSEPFLNKNNLYNSSVFDDYEDVEVVFDPNHANIQNNNSKKNIKTKEHPQKNDSKRSDIKKRDDNLKKIKENKAPSRKMEQVRQSHSTSVNRIGRKILKRLSLQCTS